MVDGAPAGGSRVYILATWRTSEEEFAQQQMRHLAERGTRVIESTAGDSKAGPEADRGTGDRRRRAVVMSNA